MPAPILILSIGNSLMCQHGLVQAESASPGYAAADLPGARCVCGVQITRWNVHEHEEHRHQFAPQQQVSIVVAITAFTTSKVCCHMCWFQPWLLARSFASTTCLLGRTAMPLAILCQHHVFAGSDSHAIGCFHLWTCLNSLTSVWLSCMLCLKLLESSLLLVLMLYLCMYANWFAMMTSKDSLDHL